MSPRWPSISAFSPANLSVSFEGLIRSLGEKGDAAVMVRYMGIVAVSRMTVPYAASRRHLDHPLPAEELHRRSGAGKMAKLGIGPSPEAPDAVSCGGRTSTPSARCRRRKKFANFSPTSRPTNATNSLIGFLFGPSMASIGRSNGATSCATSKPTPRTRPTPKNSRIGCATHLPKTCRSTSSLAI